MKYFGTRDKNIFYSLKQAAIMGLAPCGGLFMPERIPQVDMNIIHTEAEKSFAHMAAYVADLFFGEDMDRDRLRELVFDAFDFELPLHRFSDNDKLFALELFHGPTLAFKDFGARFMGRMLGELKDDGDVTILTATSGDTGSAVAGGFYAVDGVRVFILYPDGKVSDFQERQMTTLGKNIIPLKVKGTFDDCQRMVKEIFADHDYCRKNRITSANSISILRWIPQSFYYFYGYHLWGKATGKDNPTVVVPSGNFGNITAAMMAKKMGLPLGNFVAATNANDTIPNYMSSGVFAPKPSVQTISNAMDVGNPSNYERLTALYDSLYYIRKEVCSKSYDDKQTNNGIKELYEKYGYVSDPHSAIGYIASKEFDVDGFWVSTAHASKFESVIKESIGVNIVYPDKMKKYFEKEKIFTVIEPDSSVLKQMI